MQPEFYGAPQVYDGNHFEEFPSEPWNQLQQNVSSASMRPQHGHPYAAGTF